MEKVKHLFLDHYINPVISYLDQQINILKGWISFKYPLLLNIVLKNLTNVLNLKENRESSQQGQISKNLLHADYAGVAKKIAQFLFNHTEGFYNTTHVVR